ncbi:putative reverse transcriptase domain-containing protein [Tanacetum coccineum]
MTDKVVLIKEKLKAARDRQKSYADNSRKPLEFEVGNRELLKVTPWKGVVYFGKKGKLAPSLHVPLDEIKVEKTLCFVEEPVENSDREVKRFGNQSIERDRLIGIGFVLDFMEFISFTFGDKEMILWFKRFSDLSSKDKAEEEHKEDWCGSDFYCRAASMQRLLQIFESYRGGIPDLEDTIYDIVHYMSEVHIDRITEIDYSKTIGDYQLVHRDRDDTSVRLRRTMTITRSGMTPEAIEELINRRVKEALAAYEATRAANALEAENQSQNGSDDDNGNGNGENRNGGNGNQNENGRELMKLMTKVYFPRNEIQKMESELWNLTVKNNDLAAYTQRFQELTMILQDAVRIANNLMDQKLKGYAVKNAENKRRLEIKTHGNKTGNKNGVGEARGKAYVLGGGDANPNSNVVKDTFLLNNHYASMIFDSGADRSFVSTTFSDLLDITPDTINVSYAVELADGRISETNTILRGCMLGLLGHPFNIDLIPVELGSFDVIIANHHAVIVCDEKIVRIHFGDEVLIVQGDRDGKGENSKLSIISCTKTQKYIERGCPIFLAQVTKKEIENESEEKRLEDVPTVRDFLEVFLEDLPGLPPS